MLSPTRTSGGVSSARGLQRLGLATSTNPQRNLLAIIYFVHCILLYSTSKYCIVLYACTAACCMYVCIMCAMIQCSGIYVKRVVTIINRTVPTALALRLLCFAPPPPFFLFSRGSSSSCRRASLTTRRRRRWSTAGSWPLPLTGQSQSVTVYPANVFYLI